MPVSPEELKVRLDGQLAFSLTPFLGDVVDLDVLREHVELLLASGAQALFPAGGAGEFFSLTLEEYKQVVVTCVSQVAGRVPVVAGVGYGTELARQFAVAAWESGADGIMVMPPYLVDAPQDGLAAHYVAVARATPVGVILYQRGSALFEPQTVRTIADAATNVIGFKDGIGDVHRLLRIRDLMRDRLIFINGMPTAEVYASALAACSARAYSSAILAFMPEVSRSFWLALRSGDRSESERILSEAILPFAEIRMRQPGYAVSLVKAGARLRGLPVGPVRWPLRDPVPADEDQLRALLAALRLDVPLGRAATLT